uniref:Uncharacterized protein n=1 Tax=Avena sativa TaxID=4498 RepID=A0ACD5Y094_AVESA
MEVGSPTSSAGSTRGDREEAARGSDGAMRARVCARVRTPHGVGALLLVGGAIVGAAVFAWRRHGERKNSKNHHRGKEEEEVLDGGVVENEQSKFNKPDENLSREDTEVEANGLDGKKTEELHEIQAKVDEIVADELDSESADKFDPSSSRECTQSIDDMGHGDIKNDDQNSSKSGIESEITPNATQDVENSDERTLTNSSQEIAHEEHNGHSVVSDEETTSTQIIPTIQMVAHQSLISEELKTDNITETATLHDVSKHEEQKPLAQEPVAPVNSPACSSLPSLLKPVQKKRPANPGQNETGMKLGQNRGKGELSKGGAEQGATMVTMNRRATSMAILAMIFAVTVGINLMVRLYSTLRAT